MATVMVAHLVDDIDGGNAAETVTFSIDGNAFEIDLNKRNAAAMRRAFARYVKAGRPAGSDGGQQDAKATTATTAGEKKPTASKSGAAKAKPTAKKRPAKKAAKGKKATKSSGPSQAEIRAWAAEVGIDLPPRGRISNAVRDQYLAATAPQSGAGPEEQHGDASGSEVAES